MNEALHILKNFKSQKNYKLNKLDISNMKDMQTIIKETKAYLERKREEFKNEK